MNMKVKRRNRRSFGTEAARFFQNVTYNPSKKHIKQALIKFSEPDCEMGPSYFNYVIHQFSASFDEAMKVELLLHPLTTEQNREHLRRILANADD